MTTAVESEARPMAALKARLEQAGVFTYEAFEASELPARISFDADSVERALEIAEQAAAFGHPVQKLTGTWWPSDREEPPYWVMEF